MVNVEGQRPMLRQGFAGQGGGLAMTDVFRRRAGDG
jgi:hypothetical protein